MENSDYCVCEKSDTDVLLARQALNYALWAFENHTIVRIDFIEKASKSVFQLLKCVRNTPAEIQCLFIYWVLHEMLFNVNSVDEVRLQAGIENIRHISHYFHIEIVGVNDRMASAK